MEIHPLHQACRDCIFAKYDGKTQVGCQLGRLEVYRERGQVVEAYDNDLEFDVVNGTACHFFRDRNSAWAKKFADTPATQARKEVTMRIEVIVILQDGDTIEKLKNTIESVKSQELQPTAVYVIHNADALNIGDVHVFLVKNALGLNWTLTDICKRAPIGGRISWGECVDEIFSKLHGHFYVLVTPGQALPSAFLLNIDRAINDNMDRFSVLLYDLPHAQVGVVQHGFHQAFDGNKPGYAEDFRTTPPAQVEFRNVYDKAKFFADAWSEPNLVRKVTDLCDFPS